MKSSWVTLLIVIRDLGKLSHFLISFVNFRASILLNFLYFPTCSGIKTLFPANNKS